MTGDWAGESVDERLVLSRFRADLALSINLVRLWRRSLVGRSPRPPPLPDPPAAAELILVMV